MDSLHDGLIIEIINYLNMPSFIRLVRANRKYLYYMSVDAFADIGKEYFVKAETIHLQNSSDINNKARQAFQIIPVNPFQYLNNKYMAIDESWCNDLKFFYEYKIISDFGDELTFYKYYHSFINDYQYRIIFNSEPGNINPFDVLLHDNRDEHLKEILNDPFFIFMKYLYLLLEEYYKKADIINKDYYNNCTQIKNIKCYCGKEMKKKNFIKHSSKLEHYANIGDNEKHKRLTFKTLDEKIYKNYPALLYYID